jgi:hypothetical protein
LDGDMHSGKSSGHLPKLPLGLLSPQTNQLPFIIIPNLKLSMTDS